MRYLIGRIPNLRAGRNKISWQKIQAQLGRDGSADFDQLARWCVDHDDAAGGPGFVRYCIDSGWLVPVNATPGGQPTQPASHSDALNRSGKTSSTGDAGIYIAILLTDQYMPVTRDPRYVATCARVNSKNVKVGKARCFRIRESNYWQDFDRHNVEFIPIARLAEIERAETAILRRLDSYRLLSPKNGKMDWLVGISPEEVVRTAYAVLDNGHFDYQAISNRFAT